MDPNSFLFNGPDKTQSLAHNNSFCYFSNVEKLNTVAFKTRLSCDWVSSTPNRQSRYQISANFAAKDGRFIAGDSTPAERDEAENSLRFMAGR